MMKPVQGNQLTEENRPVISVVVLTYNRVAEVLQTLARLVALPERAYLIVVDNASTDGTAEAVARIFPEIDLVRAPGNLGAAGRNLGVARVKTDYVAFCDDDTWWENGALPRAIELLDAYPRIAVLSARVVVGPDAAPDPTWENMALSPLPCEGLPGPALVGFMAGTCVFRTQAFRAVGGYHPRLFIGGEEELVALDLLTAGWAIVYVADLTAHHYPSLLRDGSSRRRLLARNAAWVAWMRLPLGEALRATATAMKQLLPGSPKEWWQFLRGVGWAMRNRALVRAEILQWRRMAREPYLTDGSEKLHGACKNGT